MAVKTISIPDEQNEWLKENDKTLSKMVQKMIAKEMDDSAGCVVL